jgi:F0F1-type ATP synthase membrane subunit b/b'
VLGSVRAEGVDPKEVEKLLGDVKQQLDRIRSEVKQTAEDALKEAKNSGTLSARSGRAPTRRLLSSASSATPRPS